MSHKNRMIMDEMDIQAVESKLNDVTVTAIPMSSVATKQQSNSNHPNYTTSTKQMSYAQQQNLIQSAFQLAQQQQVQQQQQHQRQKQDQLNRLLAESTSLTVNNLGQNVYQQQGTQQGNGLSKYAQLLAVIEEMGRDIRPTYANGRSSCERLKRSIIHAKVIFIKTM